MSDTSSYKTNQSALAESKPKRPKLVKEHSDHLLSYYESSIPNEARNHARSASTPQRVSAARPTQPPARKMSTTSMSSDSDYSYDSDRDYSYDSETNETKEAVSEASSSTGVTRRSGTPSKGGADRRRMAIVQMDSANDRGYKSSSETTSSDSIRSRRGHKSNLSGLALVAPPDAALRTYTQFTPPSTAPVTGDYMNHILLTANQDKGQNRSASENPPSKKVLSRDASQSSTPGTQSILSSANNRLTGTKAENNNTTTGSVVFQKTTKSRSPSPDLTTAKDDRDRNHGLLSPPNSAYPSSRTIDMFSPIVTPEIGEGKEIHMPVAGPVVVNLEGVQSRRVDSTPSWRTESPAQSTVYGSPARTSTSAYLYYEPGVHSTAGPLPPPPRTTINFNASTPPPRPPRLNSPAPSRMRGDIEAVKQALQLPPSVTAVLAKSSNLPASKPSTPKPEEEKEEEKAISKEKEDDESLASRPSIHRREGATLTTSSVDSSSAETSPSLPGQPSPKPPSPTLPAVQEVDSPSSAPETPDNDVPAVTVLEAPPASKTSTTNKIDTAKFDQWLKENPQLSRGVSLDEARRDPSERSLSPLSAEITGDAPSPPPKSFRNSLTNNLKRFSTLPRTPSLSSRSRPSSGSTRYSSRTPSPSLHTPQAQAHAHQYPCFKKIQSSNPAALFCHEVNSQHTTIQRCAIYVAKINELYVHDCGLSEWVVETKSRGTVNTHHTQRGPSSQPFVPQPRQTSRSSMISEATFPIRPDASVATDLSHGAYRDITPPGVPPALPYPSLAMNPPRCARPSRSNSSATSGTPPSSVRSLVSTPSTKGAGFFASLGRKASLSSRKERFPPAHLSSTTGTMSSSSGRLSKHPPSTANISRPILISNPPAIPGGPRALPQRAQRSQTFTSSVLPNTERDEMGRRPSLFNLTLDTVIDIQPDPAFTRQVDQLAALLPHADRDVLAGYLRRAGQDMLAIGQYLEDERMGTIRQPF